MSVSETMYLLVFPWCQLSLGTILSRSLFVAYQNTLHDTKIGFSPSHPLPGKNTDSRYHSPGFLSPCVGLHQLPVTQRAVRRYASR